MTSPWAEDGKLYNAAMLLDGGEVVQETRLWQPDTGRTVSMRGKEDAHDYRYFPDPDLLPLVIDDEWVERMKKEMPELPGERKARYETAYDLPPADARVLTASRELADYFEACLTHFDRPKPVANWIMAELLGLLNAKGLDITESPVSPENLTGLLVLVEKDVNSRKTGKKAIEATGEAGKPGNAIVE